MADDRRIVVLYTTLPTAETAEAIARQLIEEGLVACVNILAPALSIYRWAGEVEQSVEVPILAKLPVDRAQQAVDRLRQLHPYDLPVIEHWHADTDPNASDWIAECTSRAKA